MNTSGKRRRTLLALVVVVVALVFMSGVMAYRTTHRGAQAKPTVHYSPPSTTDHRYRGTNSGTRTTSSGTRTTQQRDDDNDGVPNAADVCPYRAGRGRGENRGCPVVTTTHAS